MRRAPLFFRIRVAQCRVTVGLLAGIAFALPYRRAVLPACRDLWLFDDISLFVEAEIGGVGLLAKAFGLARQDP